MAWISSSGGSGTGSGARTVTITVNDGSAALEGAKVRLTKGAESYIGTTSVSGQIVFSLDDGTWGVAISLAGYQFTPTTLVVSGDTSHTYQLTIMAIAPSDTPQTTGFLVCYDEEGVVRYGTEDQQRSQEVPQPGTWHFNFDTSGGTHKITQSLQTLWRGQRSLSNPAPDLLGAINYDGKKVQGVEIVVPKLEFSITAYYAPQAVDTAFMVNIARKTGKVNSSARR